MSPTIEEVRVIKSCFDVLDFETLMCVLLLVQPNMHPLRDHIKATWSKSQLMKYLMFELFNPNNFARIDAILELVK